MYSFYTTANLSNDDITAIQYLYGSPSTSSSTPTMLAPTLPPSPSLPSEPAISPITFLNLCDDNPKDLQFLIIVNNLFIIHKQWNLLWSYDLERRILIKRPMQLQVLQINTANITATYQRPDGDIAVFVGNTLYIIDYPSYRIRYSLDIHTYYQLPYKNQKLLAAVNTYTGKTYLFFEDNIYVHLDELNQKVIEHGYISRRFTVFRKNVQLYPCMSN